MSGEPYWSYKAPETPTVADLPPGAFAGTQADFESLSPGMRREIARSAKRRPSEQPEPSQLNPLAPGDSTPWA